jgi:hypothetical protein
MIILNESNISNEIEVGINPIVVRPAYLNKKIATMVISDLVRSTNSLLDIHENRVMCRVSKRFVFLRNYLKISTLNR